MAYPLRSILNLSKHTVWSQAKIYIYIYIFTSCLHRCNGLTQSSLAHILVAVRLWDVSSDWMPRWVSGIGDRVVHAVFVGTGTIPRSQTQTCSALLHSGCGGQGPSLSQNPFGYGMLFNIWKRFIHFERVFWLF